MIALYQHNYLLLGFLLVVEVAITVYLLSKKGVSRGSRVTLALLMVVAAASGYLYTSDLITSQETLSKVFGAAESPGSLTISISALKLLSVLLPGLFGALGIGLAVAKPS